MLRRAGLVALALFLASCNVDALLEEEVPKDVHLSMAVATSVVTVAPGATVTVAASIRRLGEYNGEVTFGLANVPVNINATIGPQTTDGKASTVTLTFQVGASVPPADYYIAVRGTAPPNGAATAELLLRVAELPAISVSPAKSSIIIIRGGISPLTVGVARTAFTGPVNLSLSGAAGITLSATPVTGSTAATTISVGPEVAAGTYQLTLRGTGSGIPDRDAPLTVIVSADLLQLIAADAAVTQAGVATSSVVVNRNGVSGAVTLSAQGLPSGITASFPGGPASGGTASARFAVSGSVAPGAYSIALRGDAAGTSTTTALTLTVTPSNVAVSLVPQSVSLFQGTTASSVLTLVRTSFEGSVSVELVGVPTGITASVAEATITGTSTLVSVAVPRTFAPGFYPITVRAIPAPAGGDGTPSLDPITSQLAVTVIAAPVSEGNVTLDFSRCSTPVWVGAQDGIGPWSQLTGTAGRFRFPISSVRGSFAWSDGTSTNVRVMTQSELTAAPIDLCPAATDANTFDMAGTATHANANETFTWRLGGGSGTSTLASPFFTLAGVRPGTHDLIGVGFSNAIGAAGNRIHISRDIVAAPGANVGTVSLAFQNSNAPVPALVAVPGLLTESYIVTQAYHTTSACTANELQLLSNSGLSSGSLNLTLFGVAAAAQRDGDYHVTSVATRTGPTVRTGQLSYHLAPPGSTRTVALGPPVVLSAFAIGTTSHRRMRATVQALPSEYNSGFTLRYSDGGIRSMQITASPATFAPGIVAVDFPDLGSVPGFPEGARIPATSTGSWSVAIEGGTGASVCSEGATRISYSRAGTF
jgi:hypothetical protein